MLRRRPPGGFRFRSDWRRGKDLIECTIREFAHFATHNKSERALPVGWIVGGEATNALGMCATRRDECGPVGAKWVESVSLFAESACVLFGWPEMQT